MAKVYHGAQQLPLFPVKTCTRCQTEQSFDCFDKSKKGDRYGLRAVCKTCRKAEHHEAYRAEHPIPKHLPPASNGKKICRRCLKEKDVSEFGPAKRASDKLEARCRECRHEVAYVEKREQTHARTRRNWEKNGQSYKAQHKAWADKNRQKLTEIARRRDARQFLAYVEEVDYQAILERDGMWCHICEQPIFPHQQLEFDHVIPIARGGCHTAFNIKPAHKICNRRKKNKLIEELEPYHRRGIA